MKPQQEAYFMGRIAAAITHELKNILAVISETIGLLEDLANMPLQDVPPDKYLGKIKKSLTTVNAQVAKGINLADDYNRFAHILDNPTKRINLCDSIQHLIRLCSHIIHLKQIKVEQQIPEGKQNIHLTTSPFYLYMVVFEILDVLMSQLSPGSSITIKTNKNGNIAMICFASEDSRGISQFSAIVKQFSLSVEPILKEFEAQWFFDDEEKTLKLLIRDLDPGTHLSVAK
ncbi:MAG: hypothetical protein WHS38_00170 [Thermodesulforhabdaceae bacterium]